MFEPLTRSMIDRAPFEALPLTTNGQHEILRSAAAYRTDAGDFDLSGVPLSDTFNSYRLVQAYGNVIRFCGEWGKFLTYENGIWNTDHGGRVIEFGKDTAFTMLDEAHERLAPIDAEILSLEGGKMATENDSSLTKAEKADRIKEIDARLQAIQPSYRAAKAYLVHATKTLSHRKLRDMIELAKSVEPLPISPGDLDQHPMLLPTQNGVIDLQTGKLLPHDPAYLFTKKLDVTYDETADCPKWKQALAQMMGAPIGPDTAEDSEATLNRRQAEEDRAERLVKFLQRSLGLMLTGDVREQLIWIFVGNGSNGKSVVLDTLMALLGEFAYRATQDLFMAKQFESHPTEQASLFGKRFVAVSETREGSKLDAAFVKAATGGDRMTVRRMREDPWSFQPTHHIVLATNNLPVISDGSHAMWRRVRLVPFDVRFIDPDTADEKTRDDSRTPKQNKNLATELREELPGILRWCVEGCLAWQRDGLTYPDEVRMATEGYRRDQNNVQEFISEGCLTGPGYHAKAQELYEGYRTWCAENEQEPCNNSAFGKKMKELGYEPIKSNGIRRYLNIAARDTESDDIGVKKQGQDRVRN